MRSKYKSIKNAVLLCILAVLALVTAWQTINSCAPAKDKATAVQSAIDQVLDFIQAIDQIIDETQAFIQRPGGLYIVSTQRAKPDDLIDSGRFLDTFLPEYPI